MQLKTVTARFGRKRQAVQFEPAEAMLEVTMSVNEDGSVGEISIQHIGVGEKLLGAVKNIVLRELGIIAPGVSASASDVKLIVDGEATATAEATKGKPGRKPKADAAPAAAAPAEPKATTGQISTNPENRVGPEDEEIGGAEVIVGNADIPGEGATPTTVQKNVPAGPTAEELTKEASALVKNGDVDSATIKALSREFGSEKISGIPVEKLGAYKVRLDAAVKAFASASDI